LQHLRPVQDSRDRATVTEDPRLENPDHHHARPRRPAGRLHEQRYQALRPNPRLSEALNLAEAAGIYGLDDIPADKAYRARGSETGLAGAAVVGALDAGSPLPGFSALGPRPSAAD